MTVELISWDLAKLIGAVDYHAVGLRKTMHRNNCNIITDRGSTEFAASERPTERKPKSHVNGGIVRATKTPKPNITRLTTDSERTQVTMWNTVTRTS